MGAGPGGARPTRHWDGVARSWPDLFQAQSTQYYRRCEIALVERYLGDAGGKSVLKLDLWNEAVNTRLLQWIEGQGARVFGMDVSGITVGRARRNFAREARIGHFTQGDIRSLPFADGVVRLRLHHGHHRARAGVRARDPRGEPRAQAGRHRGDRRPVQMGPVPAPAARLGPRALRSLSVQSGTRLRRIRAARQRSNATA